MGDVGSVTPDLTPVPPHNLDAERAVLGCCFLGDKADITKAATILRPDDFYARSNRLIFDAILDLHLKGGGIDPLLILIELERRDHLKELGGRVIDEETHQIETGREYLASLAVAVESAANVADYCRIVRDVAMKREAVRAAIELELAGRNGHTGPEVMEQMKAHVERLSSMFANDEDDDPVEYIRYDEVDQTQWLLRGYLARYAVTLLGGLPKESGKSTLAWSMVAALQRGDPEWCGLAIPTACEAIVLSEEDRSVLGESWKAAGIDPTRTGTINRNTRNGRTLAECADWVIKKIAKRPQIGLVVVDTWRNWANLPDQGENDSATTVRIFQDVKRIAAAGVAVILLHHTKKDADSLVTAFAGSLALAGEADILMWLKKFGKGETSSMRAIEGTGKYQRIPEEIVVDRRDDGTYAACGSGGEARARMVADRIARWIFDAQKWVSSDEIEAAMKAAATDGKGLNHNAFVAGLKSLRSSKAVQCVGRGVTGSPFLYAANNVPIHQQAATT